MDFIERSLELALKTDNKVDICRAILGRSYLLFAEGKVNEALNEVTNLKVFFQVIAIPRMELSTQILLARIYQKLGQTQKALDTLWSSYEYLNKHKNLFLLVHLFYALGVVHEARGENELAKTHLNMAKSFCPVNNLKHFVKQVDAKLNEMNREEQESDFDIIFDTNNPVIIDAERGQIDFKNQFVLMDLLKLFIENPGVVYSKESLVKEVWDQDYDPRVHDNKIYVTIKRLRKLIEPQTGESKYIFRSREGYFFNKRVKVCLKK
jgi:tetratricopeptide (TPR) repeat protein